MTFDAIFPGLLLTATFLCSLIAGFLFAFAVVAMPGINRLDDGAFIRAFQVMDRVIQNNQPLFILVWVGSVAALVSAAALGMVQLDGADRLLLIGAAVVYLVGVQAPTAAVNVPLNNALQEVEVDASRPALLAEARATFETRWNRWNRLRTLLSGGTALLLMVLLLRI